MLALLGDREQADALIGSVIEQAHPAGDAITEAGARLVRATAAIADARWDDAREIALARAATERLA